MRVSISSNNQDYITYIRKNKNLKSDSEALNYLLQKIQEQENEPGVTYTFTLSEEEDRQIQKRLKLQGYSRENPIMAKITRDVIFTGEDYQHQPESLAIAHYAPEPIHESDPTSDHISQALGF